MDVRTFILEQLTRLQIESEQIATLMCESDSFINVARYQWTYKFCVQVKLRAHRLISLANKWLKNPVPGSDGRAVPIVSAVSAPLPRALQIRSVAGREEALNHISEKARAKVWDLYTLMQALKDSA